MSVCSTVSGSNSVYTSFATSTITNQQVSTAPGSTSTVSSPVLVTSCAPAPTDTSASDAQQPVCSTSTSYSVYSTVIPGSTTTIFNTGESVYPVYSTSFGQVSTICSDPPASSATPTRTSPSSTVQATATPTPTSTTETSQVVVAGPSSSTRFLTTTSTFIPGADSAVSSDGAVSPAAGAAVSGSGSSRSQEMVLSTSYLTIVFTTTDNSGHASTYASSVPTLLNVPKNNSSASSNKGAIAGGVVGGVVALIVAVLAFLFMKKRGLFRRWDDKFDEDAWAPPSHGEFYGSMTQRGRTATGATLVGGTAGGGGLGGGSSDEKIGEQDREVDAATLERHQSWYGMGGAGGRTMEEIYAEQTRFAPLPTGAAESIAAAAMTYNGGGVTRSRSDGGLAVNHARNPSNRLSMHSAGVSSHGHSQEHAPIDYGQGLPPIPDRRLSGFAYYPNYPSAPEHHRSNSFEPQRPRSASPTHHHSQIYESASPRRSNTLSPRPSINGLALPQHLRTESYGPRPTLEAIQGGGGTPATDSTDSSSSPSRRDTSDSVPTSSSNAHQTLLQHADSYGSTSSTSNYHLPQLDRLKFQRPAFERAASTDSFIAPVQWLGAKLANADSGSESGMESREDLSEKLNDRSTVDRETTEKIRT